MPHSSAKIFLFLGVIGFALFVSLFFRDQINFLSSSLLSSSLSNGITKPPASTQEDTEPYWDIGSWSSCVSGKTTRYVQCLGTEGNVLPDSKCTGPKPHSEETFSLSGPTSVTFTEASGPATYQLSLSRPDYSQALITSVSAVATPKNSGAINATHPADGSGKGNPWMSWTTQSIDAEGKSAIIRSNDYAWYGISENDGAFPDAISEKSPLRLVNLTFQYPQLGYLSSKQSVYDIDTTVTLSNGCKLDFSFAMQVKFENILDTHSRTEAFPKITTLKEIQTQVRPLASLLKRGRVYRACVYAKDVIFDVTTKEYTDLKGQYKKAVIDEENFHGRQFRGELSWENGGDKELMIVIEQIFEGTKFCASGASPEIAKQEAHKKFETIYKDIILKATTEFHNLLVPVFLFGANADISKLSEEAQKIILWGCWVEKTAKEFAGVTPKKYGGVILEHAYMGCNPDMKKPTSRAEELTRRLNEVRGFVQTEGAE